MRLLLTLIALCLCLNGLGQTAETPSNEAESNTQDLQEVEVIEAIDNTITPPNSENPVVVPESETVDTISEPAPVEIQEPKSMENETPSDENSDDKWYDFSEQMDQEDPDKRERVVVREEERELKNSNRYRMNTILDSERFAFGAFLEQTSKLTFIDDDPHLMIGGRASLVFNHRLNMGVGGYGLVSPTKWKPDEDLNGEFLVFGYGGLIIEPEFSPQNIVHVGIPVLLGAGGYGTRDSDFDNFDEGDGFWVFEPGIEIDINVARIFQIGIGGSYRFVTDGIQDNLDLTELNGPNAHLSFRLGWF